MISIKLLKKSYPQTGKTSHEKQFSESLLLFRLNIYCYLGVLSEFPKKKVNPGRNTENK